ncbi:MAG: DUF4145 domain-containing protein [Pseudomonadota bacterium]
MSIIPSTIKARFAQLELDGGKIPLRGNSEEAWTEGPEFHAWASSALNIVEATFGKQSPHTLRLRSTIDAATGGWISLTKLDICRGCFTGAKSDVDGNYFFSLETQVAGEIFGDFLSLAKNALQESKYEVAAVLACAALEDALKRYSTANGLDVEGSTMDEVINALKSKSLVGGAQKGLLAAMPKIRNHAMHAEWSKITPQDVGSVIGFTEQFLLTNF